MTIKFTFKVKEEEYSEKEIEKALPSKTMQLVFYKIKEKLEKFVEGSSVEKAIDKVVIICENGDIKEAKLVTKE